MFQSSTIMPSGLARCIGWEIREEIGISANLVRADVAKRVTYHFLALYCFEKMFYDRYLNKIYKDFFDIYSL